MPKAIFILPDDSSVEVEVPDGTSLMRAAQMNSIGSIVGDCGGTLGCATCHVMVEPAFAPLMPAISDTEDQMLDYTVSPREPNSRLSCQLLMTPALEGVTVRVAELQV